MGLPRTANLREFRTISIKPFAFIQESRTRGSGGLKFDSRLHAMRVTDGDTGGGVSKDLSVGLEGFVRRAKMDFPRRRLRTTTEVTRALSPLRRFSLE